MVFQLLKLLNFKKNHIPNNKVDINGKKFNEADPLVVKYGERIRLKFVNDSRVNLKSTAKRNYQNTFSATINCLIFNSPIKYCH